MLDKDFITSMKDKLEEEKQTIEQKISELKKPEKPMENPDLDDLAFDATDDIIEESTLAAYNDILDKIKTALARIKKGSYGICLKTKQEISKERLEIEPWAEFC